MTKKKQELPEAIKQAVDEAQVDRAAEYKQFSKELQQALYWFTNEQPFIGGLLQEMNFKPDYQIPTAALCYDKKRQSFEILIGPKFFSSMSLEHRIGVLHHEILHFTNAHVFRFGMERTDANKENAKRSNIACLPAGEFVTGVNKNIEDVVVGDVIVGQNRSAKVVATKKHQYTGNTFKIKAMGCLPFTVTDEHPVLVHSRKWRSHYPINLDVKSQWKEAKDLEIKYDYAVVPKLKPKKYDKVIDLREFILDSAFYTKLTSIKLDNELSYILGLYVAEGSKSNAKNQGIDFSLHKDETHLLEIIRKFANKFEYNTRFQVVDNKMKVSFSSTVLSRAFEQWCGRGAYNKQIPEFILYNEDTTILQSFLDGYMEGDGHFNKKVTKAGTVSKKLVLELQLAYARLGNFASIRKCERGERKIRDQILKPYSIYEIEIHKKKVSTRDFGNGKLNSTSYRWKEFPDYIAVPITSIEKTPFEGTVYNLRTENHEFAVNNVVTHNCDMAINQYIRSLPEGCVDVQYFQTDDGQPFPKFATAEVYYDLLKDNPDAMKNAAKNMKDAGMQIKGDEAFGDGETLDQHAWDALSDEEKKQMAEEMKKMVKRTMEKTQYGKTDLPDGIKDLIEEIDTFLNKMNYKQILQSAIKKSVSFTDRANTWKRPNKRYGVVAQGTTLAKLPELWELVDTSGSISVKELNEFLAVVDGFLKAGSRKCMVGFWHTKLYKLKKYKLGQKIKQEEIESGGTDMTDTITKINEKRPDLSIILTDGYYDTTVLPETECVIVISDGGTLDHPLKDNKMVKTISMKGLK